MRIEAVNGRNLVCGHIFPANELQGRGLIKTLGPEMFQGF